MDEIIDVGSVFGLISGVSVDIDRIVFETVLQRIIRLELADRPVTARTVSLRRHFLEVAAGAPFFAQHVIILADRIAVDVSGVQRLAETGLAAALRDGDRREKPVLLDPLCIGCDAFDILLRTHRLAERDVDQHSQQEYSCQDPSHEFRPRFHAYRYSFYPQMMWSRENGHIKPPSSNNHFKLAR